MKVEYKGEMPRGPSSLGSYTTKMAFPHEMKERFDKIVNHPNNREFRSISALIRYCCDSNDSLTDIIVRLQKKEREADHWAYMKGICEDGGKKGGV